MLRKGLIKAYALVRVISSTFSGARFPYYEKGEMVFYPSPVPQLITRKLVRCRPTKLAVIFRIACP